MPLYEYKCKCGEITEEFFHSTEIPPGIIQCEMCGKKAFRVMSAPSHFVVWDYSAEAWNTNPNVSRKKAGIPLI